MVPSYNGVCSFFAWLTGLIQVLVPSARPMKVSTARGALSGKSVQVMLPALVSMTALGRAGVGAGGLAGVFVVCAKVRSENSERRMAMLCLRMSPPGIAGLLYRRNSWFAIRN